MTFITHALDSFLPVWSGFWGPDSGDSIPNSFPDFLASVSAAKNSAQEFFPDSQRNHPSLNGDQFFYNDEAYPLLPGKEPVKIRPSQEANLSCHGCPR